ncbi:MAG: hypothetical protein IPL49_18030 [Saprospirales bacterium]|nr:hypothetical protein [Saprospirales bacterium]
MKAPQPVIQLHARKEGLVVEHHQSIRQIDAADWDGLMASRGNFPHA